MESNATYLFEKPMRAFHNAESWWTAYFSMLVFWRNANNRALELPHYISDANGNLTKAGIVSFAGATYANLVCDARLHGEPFSISGWPNEFLHLRPDVTHIRSLAKRRVVFVETKTIGASVKGNVKLYSNLVAFLRSCGWSVELYYLLSMGHEEQKDWARLAVVGASIICWEDVFDGAKDTPLGQLFGEPLSNYNR